MNKLELINLIKNSPPFLLAPMDDITDYSFRKLCEKFGALYTTTELISVEALIRNKVPFFKYMKRDLNINSIQLFGTKPESFLKAAKIIEKEADIIDINFGCPSPSVTKGGAGSFLLNDPKNVYEIVKILVDNFPEKAITAKIRLGYEKTNTLEIAREIERAGAALITIHGRTAKQGYTGKANWEEIKKVYEKIKIPIIGNGDIKNVMDIDKYLYKYSDGLMIGRAAIGHPLIFKNFRNYYLFKNNKLENFNLIDKNKETQKKLFLEYLKEYENIINKLSNNKKILDKLIFHIQHQAMYFMKGIEGSKKLRIELSKEKDLNKIIKIIEVF
jgi:nifR3 family TIM-barrel protein